MGRVGGHYVWLAFPDRQHTHTAQHHTAHRENRKKKKKKKQPVIRCRLGRYYELFLSNQTIPHGTHTHTHLQTIGGRDELDKQKIDVVVDNNNAAGCSFSSRRLLLRSWFEISRPLEEMTSHPRRFQFKRNKESDRKEKYSFFFVIEKIGIQHECVSICA